MKNKIYGYIEPLITEEHYVLGSSKLNQVVLQIDGDWLPYTPFFEPQQRQFETYNCTSFNTLNCLETLFKRLGVDGNYSDRFLGIVAGTKPPGNDPHVVAEAIRKHGLIPEAMLPFSDDLKTVEEYYSFKGADEAECRKAGKEWLKKWNFGHEWVFQGDVPNRAESMLEALKYSPLGVSVNAWKKNGDLYTKVKGSRDNHWTACIVGYDKDNFWLIDDSYLDQEKPLKKLDWNYPFGFCKRFHVEERPYQPSCFEKLLNLLK